MKQQHLQSSLLIPLLEQESAGRKVMGSGHTHTGLQVKHSFSPLSNSSCQMNLIHNKDLKAFFSPLMTTQRIIHELQHKISAEGTPPLLVPNAVSEDKKQAPHILLFPFKK